MSFFISDAIAATNAMSYHGNPMISTGLMLVGFALIFYFFIWRPQSRRMKQQRDLLSSLKVGDEVMMTGGLIGILSKLDDNFAILELADKVEVVIQKSAITTMLPKGTIKQTLTGKHQ